MPITVADLQVRVGANVRDAQGALGRVQTTAAGAASGMAGAFQNAGPQIGRAVTAGATAAGFALTGAVEASAQLADQMANVRTVVPDADIAALTDEVQELSRVSGVGTTDLTAGLYDLVSAGVSAEDAIGVLAASTNLAIGGLGTTAGAADVVTSALNAYGMSADQAGAVTDIFALAIQKGKVTADEIGASIANIAPIAASAGVSLEEVGAGYAALTAKGVPAAQAATQMRAAISALLTPNETLNSLQEQTGINFAELARDKGLAVALEELRVATEGNATALDKLAGISAEDFPAALAEMQSELGLTNTEVEKFSRIAGADGAGAALAELAKEVGVGDSAMGKALGSIEAYQFSLNATGDDAASFGGILTDMYDATGTAADQAAIKMDSPVEAGKRLFAQFATFAQDVGAPFASTLGPILFGLNQMSPALRGLISPARLAGAAVGNLAGRGLPALFRGLQGGVRNIPTALGYFDLFVSKMRGVGSAVAGLAPRIASGLGGALMGVVPMLAGAVTGVVSGIGALFAAAIPLLVAALPFLLIGAIIAAIVLLIVSPEIREKVFEFIGGVIDWIGDALSGLADFLGGIFGGAFDAVAGVVGAAIDVITAPIRFFIDLLAGMFGGVAENAGSVWDAVTGIIGGAIDVITLPIKIFIALIGALWNGFAAAARTVWNIIKSIVGGAVTHITGVINGIISVVQAVWSIVSGIFGAISGAASAVGSVVNAITGGGATSKGKMPQYQEGAWRVPDTGIALVHQDEMILPPGLAESFRQFLGGGGGGAPAPLAGGSAGAVIHQQIIVPITGLLRAERPSDVADNLRRAASLGYLTPPPFKG